MPESLFAPSPAPVAAPIPSSIPEWLQPADGTIHLAWDVLASRLGFAMVFGLIVAGIYRTTQKRPPGHMMPMLTTLVLLTILVAMTTIVIGDSIARAFGLVGALSIVRFRTVVEDTRDTSFVIFAVVVGMAMGAGNVLVCLVGMPFVAAIAYGLSYVGRSTHRSGNRRLEVRIGVGRDPESMLATVFGEHLQEWKMVSIVSARQGASLDVHYDVRMRDVNHVLALVRALQAVEGVQSVELQED